MSDTNDMRRDFEDMARGPIIDLTRDEDDYLNEYARFAWTFWQAATERATASQDVNRLDFLSKQVDRLHTGDGGYSARLKFRWENSIIETSLRDAIDAAIRQGGAV